MWLIKYFFIEITHSYDWVWQNVSTNRCMYTKKIITFWKFLPPPRNLPLSHKKLPSPSQILGGGGKNFPLHFLKMPFICWVTYLVEQVYTGHASCPQNLGPTIYNLELKNLSGARKNPHKYKEDLTPCKLTFSNTSVQQFFTSPCLLMN